MIGGEREELGVAARCVGIERTLPCAEPAAIGGAEIRAEEFGVDDRRRKPFGVSGGGGRFGQCGQHESVPFSEDLRVESGPDTGGTMREQRGSASFDGSGAGEVPADRTLEDVRTLPIPGSGDAIPTDDILGIDAADRTDLVDGPDVELALDAFGIGILGGEESAGGMTQLIEDVADRLVECLSVSGLSRELPCMEINTRQQGLVVEHLLEMGDEPATVGRVPGEATTEMVVDAAGRHGVKGEQRARKRRRITGPHRMAQQGVDRERLGEFGSVSESAVALVGLGDEGIRGSGEELIVEGCPGRRDLVTGGDGLGHRFGLLLEIGSTGAPELVDPPAELGEPEVITARLLGEVGAGVERAPVREAEDRHRPAPSSRHGLNRVHVHGVDVGPLFAVDLDVDEESVHEGTDLRVLEGLVGHHMAPVTRRVTDRDEHGDIASLGLGQCIGGP